MTAAWRPLDFLWLIGPLVLMLVLAHALSEGFDWIPRALALPWALVAPRVLLRRRAVVDVAPRVERVGIEIGLGLALGLGIWVIAIFVSLALHMFGVVEPMRMERLLAPGGGSQTTIIVLAILAVTLGPIAEETMCRGFVMSALRQRMRLWLAIGLQAVIFVALHGAGLLESMILLVPGVGLGIVFWWRRSLWASSAAHILINVPAAIALIVAATSPQPFVGVGCRAGAAHCEVASVAPGSAAAGAELTKGDVIVAIDGVELADDHALAEQIGKHTKVGQRVVFSVERAGVRRELDVIIGDRRAR